MPYEKSRERTAEGIMKAGIVPVIALQHITDANGDMKVEYLINAVRAAHDAGYPAELTFRIPQGLLREAMQQICRDRESAYDIGRERRLIGIGSIACLPELEAALNMDVDFVVAPANGIGGYTRTSPRIDFVRYAHQANVFAAPAAFSPAEVGFYLFRDDGLRPDALKIFNSELYLQIDPRSLKARPDGSLEYMLTAKPLQGLLAPFLRLDGQYENKGFVIMPTGAVSRKTGPEFQRAIYDAGFTPVLGMSDPFDGVRKKAGGLEVYVASVTRFGKEFTPYVPPQKKG